METKTCEWCGASFSRRSGYSNPVWARQRACSLACGAHVRYIGERGDRYRERLGTARRRYNEEHPEENLQRLAKTAATRGMSFPAKDAGRAGRAKALAMVETLACSACGTPKTTPKSLHRHHVDHDPTNNRPENVVVLCHACHVAQHRTDGSGFGHKRKA